MEKQGSTAKEKRYLKIYGLRDEISDLGDANISVAKY